MAGQVGQAPIAPNPQTGTSYSLQASDANATVTLSNTNPITLTVPAGLSVGVSYTIVQLGNGLVTFSASSTTINQRLGLTKTAGQYAVASLICYATDVYSLVGDLQ